MKVYPKAGILCGLVLLLAGGCATQTVQQTATLDRTQRTLRIVVMPVDVQLSALTAGGLAEPRAEWTEAAQRYIQTALVAEAKARDIVVVAFEERGTAAERDQAVEFVRVHRAVGKSILLHQYGGLKLPSKGADSTGLWARRSNPSVARRTPIMRFSCFCGTVTRLPGVLSMRQSRQQSTAVLLHSGNNRGLRRWWI